MEVFEVILLAIVQAVTEFVPVSSSGHLIAAAEGLEIEKNLGLDVLLHFGTLIAMISYFYKDIIELLKNLSSKNKLLRNIILTTIPAVIFGLLFSDFLEGDARQFGVVIFMLAAVGLLMIFSERLLKSSKQDGESITPSKAWQIGLAQSIALIPGTSRSGITMLAAKQSGMNNREAARYAFLVGVPVIFGATVRVLFDADTQDYIADYPFNTMLGVLIAATLGYLVLRVLIEYVSHNGLVVFGYYRLALAAVLFIMW